MGKETAEAFDGLVNSLERLLAQADDFTFLSVLRPELGKLKEIVGKPYTWFLTELGNRKMNCWISRKASSDLSRSSWEATKPKSTRMQSAI